MEKWLIVALAVVLTAVGGWLVGRTKGRDDAGCLLGLFFSVLGILVVAVMPPSKRWQAQRDDEAALAIRQALAQRPATEASTQTPELRKALIAEALRRDPSLADVKDPAAMKRLSTMVADLESEYRLRLEVQEVNEERHLE